LDCDWDRFFGVFLWRGGIEPGGGYGSVERNCNEEIELDARRWPPCPPGDRLGMGWPLGPVK
jgi:hypothetical protein